MTDQEIHEAIDTMTLAPVNPHSRRWTLESFTKKYFGGEPVERPIAKEFWSDFRLGYVGSLTRYIRETTEIV